jgi:monoamine oxidase
MESDYDVIVIGAGLAGITAARECSTRGLSTIILEARNRVGGRTYTSRFSSGEVIDAGGAHVHWTQPHLWAEVTRYGLEDELVDAGEKIDEVCAPTADGLKWYSPEEHYARERRLLNAFYEPSSRVFPKPYQPLLMKDELAKFDISLDQRLAQMNFSADDEALLRSRFAGSCGGPLSEASFLALMRWYALGGHDYDGMRKVISGTSFKNGVATLTDALLADGNTILKLSSPATEIEQRDQGVRVKTRDGETYSARVCVVATPSGVWADVKFFPSLSENRLKVSRARALQQPAGVAKMQMILKGERRRFFIVPELGHPIGMIWTWKKQSDDVQFAQARQSPAMRDAADLNEVTAAINALLPHVEVLELVTETWYPNDPFSRGGYAMYQAGVLTREEPPIRLAQPEGRLVFATSDISRFWCSFMDGAIESGLRAGHQVRTILAQSNAR